MAPNLNNKLPIVHPISEDDKIQSVTPVGADFETAVSATGLGKFNFILFLVAIPASFSSMFETSSMSYVFTVANCDLDLTLDNKGMLNAITYIGMIVSATLWGFLSDTLGRKKLMVAGFFADAFFVFMSALSPNITVLMISKFFGGFIINGPFVAMTCYLAEFHSSQYRPRIQMILGLINAIGGVVLALLAWLILPQTFTLSFFNDSFDLHAWNLYLFICALPSLSSGLIFIFLPESPKFLMTTGRNDQALKVFQQVYMFNSGKPKETYPIKQLVNELDLNISSNNITANRSKIQALKEGWQQLTPLFRAPYKSQVILVCAIQMFAVMSLNCLRLWLPQIFQVIADYQHLNNGTSATLCTMLEVIQPKPLEDGECFVNTDNGSAYLNSIIVALVTMIGYTIAGVIITLTGKKKLLVSLGMVAGLTSSSIFLAPDVTTTVALSSIYITLTSIFSNVVLAITVDLFPTTLRTMTVSLGMMLARTGAIFGNILFPYLLIMGCEPPFFFVGAVVIIAALLGLLLPNTEKLALI